MHSHEVSTFKPECITTSSVPNCSQLVMCLRMSHMQVFQTLGVRQLLPGDPTSAALFGRVCAAEPDRCVQVSAATEPFSHLSPSIASQADSRMLSVMTLGWSLQLAPIAVLFQAESTVSCHVPLTAVVTAACCAPRFWMRSAEPIRET